MIEGGVIETIEDENEMVGTRRDSRDGVIFTSVLRLSVAKMLPPIGGRLPAPPS
jgi:hypothetical protein